MGRAKLVIKKIENPSACQVTYSKRRNGIIKKAAELSILCGIDVGVIMFSPVGRMTSYAPSGRVEDVFLRYFNISPKLRGGPIPNEENIVQRLMRMKIDGELIDQISKLGICFFKSKAFQRELAMIKEQVNAAKQKLRFYMPDVQNIRTLTQAELHEKIVLTALKRLEIIRENLENKKYSSQQTEIIKVPLKEIENTDTMSLDSTKSKQSSPRDDESKEEEIIKSSSYKPNGTTTSAADVGCEAHMRNEEF